MSATTLEMSPKKEKEVTAFLNKRDRLEENAPRYDVEYYVDAKEERDAVMKAHSLMMEDFGDKSHVVVTANVAERSAPGEKYAVMIVVAGEVRKNTFEAAETAYLVDSGNKHHLWCLTDYEIPEKPTDSFEDSEYESFEEVEMELLR